MKLTVVAVGLAALALSACGATAHRVSLGEGGGSPQPPVVTTTAPPVPLDTASPTGFRSATQPVCAVNPDGTEKLSVGGAGAAGAARLPVDFQVVAVDWCQSTTVRRGDLTVAVLQHRQATGDFSTFVADLRGPDGPPAPSGQVACAAYADLVPELVVTDPSGRVFAPRFPQDYCGHFYGRASADFRKLTYRVVSQIDLQVVDSGAAERSGCSYRFKSLSELYATNETPPTAAGAVLSHPLTDPTVECDYARGSDGVGTLTAGRAVSRSKLEALDAAFASLPAAAPCTVTSPAFVLLTSHGWTALVEQGGCRRVAGEEFRLHASTPAVYAALALPN